MSGADVQFAATTTAFMDREVAPGRWVRVVASFPDLVGDEVRFDPRPAIWAHDEDGVAVALEEHVLFDCRARFVRAFLRERKNA